MVESKTAKYTTTMNVPETVLAAMRQTNELFKAEVVEAQNTDALDRIYTINARILPPGSGIIEGRERIKTFWRQAIDDLKVKSVKLATVDAEPLGDSVFEIGQAELIQDNGQTVRAKYVVHWKQEDGNWKWHVDIWNLNEYSAAAVPP